MLNKCMFCDETAKPWPEYASEYIKGYPLCELHKEDVLDASVTKTYDKNKQERYDGFVWAKKLFDKACDELVDELERHYGSDENLSPRGEGIEIVVDAMFGAKLSDKTPCLGEPVKEEIDDIAAERAIAHRLKLMAAIVERSGMPYHRCRRPVEGAPDGRCRNAATKTGQCTNHSKGMRGMTRYLKFVESEAMRHIRQMREDFDKQKP